ncbi:MAG: hypothetical protein OCD76_19055 [Reichenbachiella sp.]
MQQPLPFKSALFVLLLSFFAPSVLLAQANDNYNLAGTSKITHYTKADFGIETQFWSMTEDEDGVIFFGTNKGVSILNGQNWTHLKMPNGSEAKAVITTQDNRIIVGAFNEFGEIIKDQYGQYTYRSLLSNISTKEIDFNAIWQIVAVDQYIILRSFKALIMISKNKTVVLPTDNSFRHLSIIQNKILVVNENGINQLDPNSLEIVLVCSAHKFNNEQIIATFPYDENKIIAFSREGNSYLLDRNTYQIEHNKYHFENSDKDQIFSALKTSKGEYLLGTINSHLKYFDASNSENSKYRKDINDKTILNLHESRNGNIWAMLNRGVDCINTSFPGSGIFNGAAIYGTIIHNQKLFIATNQGVHVSKTKLDGHSISNSDFELIPGLEAQTWSLSIHENKVLVGHDNGAFYLDKNYTPHHIKGTTGIWKIIKVEGKDHLYLGCGYQGLYVIQYINNEFVLLNYINNFIDSTRDIVPSKKPNEYWICHGYKGVFRVKLNNGLTEVVSREHFTNKNGLPTYFGVNVTNYKDEVVFLCDYGPYRYVDSTNLFVPHQELQNIFKSNKKVTKLLQYQNTTWFIQDNSLGFFSLSKPDQLNKNLFASLDGTFITNDEFLYPLSSQSILVGTNEGLYLFNHTSPTNTLSIPTFITGVSHKDEQDSTIAISLEQNKKTVFKHSTRSLIFNYSAPKLNPKKGVKYRYKLNNFDNNWSGWTTRASMSYSYLKPGEYSFSVQAKDELDYSSEPTTYSFEILPPWYKTSISLLLYLILAVAFLVISIILVKRKIKKSLEQGAKLRKLLELEIQQVKLEKEKELISKDNEQLEEDIISKSKEVANYTLLLVKKHDVMTEVNKTLNEIKKEAKLEKTKNQIRLLAKKISLNLKDEEHLQVFDTNFERVHQEFFNELKTKFPDLTQKELRLCGFVKMNMTNKEIASILNISVRGIETARYRIRKRLSLNQDINFVEFLDKLSISTEEDIGNDAPDEL